MTFVSLIAGGFSVPRERAVEGTDGGQRAEKPKSLERARKIVAEFALDPANSAVDSLIADRRCENACDEYESASWFAAQAGMLPPQR